MQALDSHPAADGVVDGRPTGYFVRFDGPVDHYRSRLFITRGGQVVGSLDPRLDSEPNVLFARAPELEPGDYEFRWSVRSLRDGHVSDGFASFAVRRAPGSK